MVSFVVVLAESGGRSGKVAEKADAGPWVFSCSAVLSNFNFFNGGASDVLSEVPSPRGRGEVDCI